MVSEEKSIQKAGSLDSLKSYQGSGRHNKNMKKFIKMGSNSSVLLLSLIDDILDLSKMERGTFTVNYSEFVLEEVIKECYDIFYFQWALKKINLEFSVPRAVKGLLVYSDSGRIRQAMLNLLSNSFKFTFEGGIKIGIKICTKEEKRFMCLSVEDTGIGIKDVDQKKLFKLFGMIANKKLKNISGSGIGLTVTRKYIEHLDGEINLKSEFGKGTKVEIFLPLIKLPSEIEKRLETCNLPSVGTEQLVESDSCLELLLNQKYSKESNATKFICN